MSTFRCRGEYFTQIQFTRHLVSICKRHHQCFIVEMATLTDMLRIIAQLYTSGGYDWQFFHIFQIGKLISMDFSTFRFKFVGFIDWKWHATIEWLKCGREWKSTSRAKVIKVRKKRFLSHFSLINWKMLEVLLCLSQVDLQLLKNYWQRIRNYRLLLFRYFKNVPCKCQLNNSYRKILSLILFSQLTIPRKNNK